MLKTVSNLPAAKRVQLALSSQPNLQLWPRKLRFLQPKKDLLQKLKFLQDLIAHKKRSLQKEDPQKQKSDQ